MIKPRVVKESKYPETTLLTFRVGRWTVIHSAIKAKALRSSGHAGPPDAEAKSGLYIPGHALQWTDSPTPPKYVREAAERAIRRRRREVALPA